MKRMKLLLLTGSLNIGGTERNILHLASALDRNRYEIEVWCNYEGQPLQREIERLGLPCRALKVPSAGRHFLARIFRHNLPYQLRLWRMLRRFRPDVLHVFGFPTAYYGVLLGRLAGVRRIIFSVQDWDVWKKSRVYRLLDGICSRMASSVIADGVGARDLAIHAQGMSPAKVRVIYDGVNTRELIPTRSRDDVLRELELDPARPVAAVIARLDVRKKGQDVFLKAIPVAAAQSPELQYLLVGGGPDEETLRALARRLPPDIRPHFAGFRADLANILHSVDIVVIPSVWESVPKILLEAMWCSRPVAAMRVGDIEQVLDAGCGILIAPGSPDEIAQSLVSLTKDPLRRQALGAAARRRIEKMELTLDKTIRHYDEIYRAMIRS